MGKLKVVALHCLGGNSHKHATQRWHFRHCAEACSALADWVYPAGPNRLDDLCTRYGIDNSRRAKHGALLDAEILAEVYIELIGARQAELGLEEARGIGTADLRVSAIRIRSVPLLPRISAEEREAHVAFVATLGANAIWRDYSVSAAERKAAAG